MLSVAVTPYERVRESLEAHGHPVKNGSACCPAHDDRSPSLSVSEGADGRAVIHCHAGCQPDAVLAALDLNMTDLFPPKMNGNGTTPSKVVARYPYTDEYGELLYTVERYEPGFDGKGKSFAQVPASGRKGKGAMDGVRLVLYRLPKVIDAVAQGHPVFVVEGEKDVEALERAGHVATCNPAGAGKWAKVVDAVHYLTGAKVIIVADRDDSGDRHARQVANSLFPVAASIIVAEAEHGKDATDHLQAGLDAEDFNVVAGEGFASCPTVGEWLDGPAPDAPPSEDDDEADSWTPVDLGPVLAGEVVQPMPDIMIRHDGSAMLYEKAVNGIHGDSGSGKGWLVCHTIARQARRGFTSMLIDFEDVAVSITSRLIELGMTHREIIDHLIYIRPQAPPTPAVVAELITIIKARDVRLVVVDSLGEAFATEGIDENADKEVGPWYRRVARPLADAGPAVWLIDHSTKANDNPLHPSGSKRKRAQITGASYYVESLSAFVKGTGGRMRLTCAKDRHGNYRRGEVVAYLVMECPPFGRMNLELFAPALSETKVDLAVILAARSAVKAAQKEGGELSQKALIGLMEISAGTETKRGGIDLAVARGALKESPGAHGARLFSYLSEFPETPDDA